ncbi:aldehyde dehydrogenase family protein, partial [Micromonospora sp. NPDC047753]
MALRLADDTAWADILARAVTVAPEAFGAEVDGVTTLHNLVEGEWRAVGQPAPVRTPVDNTVLINLPRVDATTARAAVAHAAAAHRAWARTPLADRRARVAEALDSLTAHRDLLALLLVW